MNDKMKIKVPKGRTMSYIILDFDELMIEAPVLNGCDCWLGADITQA
jgi:hypothetical protein